MFEETPPGQSIPGVVTEWTGRGEAMILGGTAGVLFVTEGLYLQYNVIPLVFSSVACDTAGALSAVAGLALLLFSGLYRTYGGYRSHLGTLVVLISAGDLWFGGGFWVGTILGVVAGVLMITLPPYARIHQPS